MRTLGSIINSQIRDSGKADPEFISAFNELRGGGGSSNSKNPLGLRPIPSH